MWIDVEHLGEEIRRENRRFAVKVALAAVLAVGVRDWLFRSVSRLGGGAARPDRGA